jgi:hypothetical protein
MSLAKRRLRALRARYRSLKRERERERERERGAPGSGWVRGEVGRVKM